MWLVSRDRISEDDRALILLSQGGGGSPPLGHILVKKDFISQSDLEKELEELALTIVRRAASSQRAAYEFVDGGGEGQLDGLRRRQLDQPPGHQAPPGCDRHRGRPQHQQKRISLEFC